MLDTSTDTRKLDIKIPEIKELLASGVQFGHQTQKWNPKMQKYIFTDKNKIHIIDLLKTEEILKEVTEFLFQVSKKGNVLFVGTKRQASEIVKNAAVDSGAFFITNRWPGGLLTNFKHIQKSLKKLNQMEMDFEKGIVNRTKFEVNQLKKEWERMNRIYEGVKIMDRFPVAMIVVDSKYEKNAIREAKAMKIPVVALVDTNCDPDAVDYPIPANDDAIKSVTVLVNTLGQAIKQGNMGRGVKHALKDYSNYEVQVVKKELEIEQLTSIGKEYVSTPTTPASTFVSADGTTSAKGAKSRGILEGIQESNLNKGKSPIEKTKVATKKVVEKPVKKTETKVDAKVEVKAKVTKPAKAKVKAVTTASKAKPKAKVVSKKK